jgi:hypothetical protein
MGLFRYCTLNIQQSRRYRERRKLYCRIANSNKLKLCGPNRFNILAQAVFSPTPPAEAEAKLPVLISSFASNTTLGPTYP